MDDFHQSTAPVVHRRRSTSSRRLLGLLVVLALLLLLPGRALADRTSTALWQLPAGTGTALAYDAANEDAPPTEQPSADPAADSSEPAPAPSEPAPAPSDPAPSDPTPPPDEPAPAPSDPAPAPADPTPPPSDPAPVDPAPPADEVPADPAPAPSEPAPADPAPRDGRATTPKPPASEERQLPAAGEGTPIPVPAAPATTAPSTSADANPAAEPAKPAGDERDDSQAKVVRAAFKRLGLGTVATPVAVEDDTSVAAVLAQACTPLGTAAVPSAPQVGSGLPTHATGHTRRAYDDPPAVRGPPAPLESPSSPTATVAGASAGTGGASGCQDCAILADQIAFTLADGGCAPASYCCDHVAPAPANAAARAPPVV